VVEEFFGHVEVAEVAFGEILAGVAFAAGVDWVCVESELGVGYV